MDSWNMGEPLIHGTLVYLPTNVPKKNQLDVGKYTRDICIRWLENFKTIFPKWWRKMVIYHGKIGKKKT